MSARLAAALLEALDDAALDELAERLAPRLADRLATNGHRADEWLDSRGAIAHLGLPSADALQREKRNGLPCHQDVPRGKCWFKRSELDDWRQSQ